MDTDASALHHFLVEIWVESRQIEGAVPLVRARARNLDNGVERYVKSPVELTDFISESLARSGREGSLWQGEPE